MNKFLSNILLAVVIFFSTTIIAQNDSTQIDSVLLSQQTKGDLMIVAADSTRLADSLQQDALLAEIAALKNQDEAKKKELQTKIDSLKKSQEERNLKIKYEVDSLRANTVGVPVLLFDDTLFYIYSKLGAFTAKERAERASSKIEALVDNNTYDAYLLKALNAEESYDVVHDDIILLSITDRDAFWFSKTKKEVADELIISIKKGVDAYIERTGFWNTMFRIGMLLIVIALFYFGIKYMLKGIAFLNKKILIKTKPFIQGIKFKEYEFISAEKETQALVWVLKLLKWLLIIIVVYMLLPIVFSIFPSTKGIANSLFGYILTPIKGMVFGFIGFIPSLITIIVIILISRYFLRFLKFLASEIENENLKLPGFYPDWAIPTFNLIKVIIYAFTFVVIFPYLPGSDSPVFQGLGVFFGLLISLGSSSAIGNIIAGFVITYMRPFKPGDRIKVGDITGDVIAKTMLVTRVRTIKNEDITIPNTAILNGSTTNYSSSAKDLGLILNTTITIGYDVPWKKVHQLLINAAKKTTLVNAAPDPFVLQTSLDDFYVSYQINAYTSEASKAAKIYSELYENIQDEFNEAGVEILSPHYRAERDGNVMAVPSEYLPKDYKAPSFNVKIDNDGKV